MKKICDIIKEDFFNKEIKEDFKLKKKGKINMKNYEKKFFPEKINELKKIIKSKILEFGTGTKNEPLDLSDISLSKMDHRCNLLLDFFHEYNLRYIDVSTWEMDGWDDIHGIFSFNSKLEGIYGLDTWDVKSAKDFSIMFKGCISLEFVEGISEWQPQNPENISEMFEYCRSIKTKLELNDAFKKVNVYFNAFKDVNKKYLPEWVNDPKFEKIL